MRVQVRRLGALTGLRFVAAGAVIYDHVSRLGRGGRADRFGAPAWLGWEWPMGQGAVAFFFVLSGFILAHVYPRLDSRAEVGRFLLARFARLWPAHLAGVVLSMLVARSILWPDPGPFNRWAVLASHLAMLQSWFPTHGFSAAYNGPSWSISTEFAFYLFFIPLVRNWSRTWWWKLPLTLAVPLGVTAAAAHYGWPFKPPYEKPDYDHFLYFGPLARLYQFALGMALALLYRRTKDGLRVGPALGTAVELGCVALVAASMQTALPAADALLAAPELGRPFWVLLYACSLWTILPLALLVFVMAHEWGYLSRLLACGPSVFLGEISYGVYILHWPVLMYLVRHEAGLAAVPGWAVGAGFLALLVGLSHLMYVWLETPARRYLTGLWPAGASGRVALGTALRSRPARRAAEAALLAAAAALATTYAPEASFRYVRPDEVPRLVKFAPPSTRNVEFGGCYRLLGATLHQAEGGIQLRMVWESLKPQPPRFHVWVKFHDWARPQPIVAALDDVPDTGRDIVPAGRMWEQRVLLPRAMLALGGDVSVAVINRDANGSLPVSGGRLDPLGTLRLLPPESPPAPGETARAEAAR